MILTVFNVHLIRLFLIFIKRTARTSAIFSKYSIISVFPLNYKGDIEEIKLIIFLQAFIIYA